MESARFNVDNKVYSIPRSRVPRGSLLDLLTVTTLSVEREENVFKIPNITHEDFDHVYDYLVNGIYPPEEALLTFDYLGVVPFSDYELSSVQELEMRAKMYLPEYESHPMNTDPHYNLVKITEELWNDLLLSKPRDPDLLFRDSPLQKQPWNIIQQSLQKLKPLLAVSPHLFVAGGRVFSALFGARSSDVDLFLHSSNPQQAEALIYDLGRHFGAKEKREKSPLSTTKVRMSETRFLALLLDMFDITLGEDPTPEQIEEVREEFIRNHNIEIVSVEEEEPPIEPVRVCRTKNTVTFIVGEARRKQDYQLILRLYRTPSEILHGFDVDSCCLGYDGKDIWATQRALFALSQGYNTVNFDRLSPSYEHRLVKYGTRGVSIKVPNFTRAKVEGEAMKARWDRFAERDSGNMSNRYREIKGKELDPKYEEEKQDHALRGLDILLYMEFHCRQYRFTSRVLQTVENLAGESSDYSPLPYTRYGHTGGSIQGVINYLFDSANRYPVHSAQYLPYIESIVGKYILSENYGGESNDDINDELLLALDFMTNNIPSAPELGFLTVGPSYLRGSPTVRELYVLNHLPEPIYRGLGVVRPWALPREIQFKTVNPGEQFTGTFHRTVLEDNRIWYQGLFYKPK